MRRGEETRNRKTGGKESYGEEKEATRRQGKDWKQADEIRRGNKEET